MQECISALSYIFNYEKVALLDNRLRAFHISQNMANKNKHSSYMHFNQKKIIHKLQVWTNGISKMSYIILLFRWVGYALDGMGGHGMDWLR